jgi:GTPase SAR1 family protein
LIPYEVLQEGTQRIASYITALNRFPRTKSHYRTKLIVLGDQGCGKTALIDSLFPLSGDLEASEGLSGYFKYTPYFYHLEGSRLKKFASREVAQAHEPPLDEVYLCKGDWTVTPIEDWANYGVHLSESSGPARQFYLYTDSAAVRDTWLDRLQRASTNSPTVGINFLHYTINHPVVSQATPDQQPLEISVLDFSGDRDHYFQGQQLLLQTRAVYLVVFNLSRGGVAIRGLRFWLRALAARFPSELAATDKPSSSASSSPVDNEAEKAAFQNLYSVIVVGTHSDDSFLKPELLRSRTESVKKAFTEAGLAHPLDYIEVSCKTGANIDALQSAVYFVPLTHSYMGERLPKIYQVVEKAVLELRKTHSSFPIVDVNRIVEHCLPIAKLDQMMVKVSLKVLSAWGRCLYFDNSEELSSTVILDPQFFVKEILFKVFSRENRIKMADGILLHQDLKQLWPAISSRKNFPDLANQLIRYFQQLGLSLYSPVPAHSPTPTPTQTQMPTRPASSSANDILSQRSVFPSLLPEFPPAQLSQKVQLESVENWWPEKLSAGFIELHRAYEFTHLTSEFASYFLVQLHKVLNHKVMWRYGSYHENWRLKALVQFETFLEELDPSIQIERQQVMKEMKQDVSRAHDSSDDEEWISDDEGPNSAATIQLHQIETKIAQLNLNIQTHLFVKVRGDKRRRCREVMSAVDHQIMLALKTFAGMKVKLQIPSPFHHETLFDLDNVGAALSTKQNLYCSATNKEVDPESLLIQAGLADDPEEKRKMKTMNLSMFVDYS